MVIKFGPAGIGKVSEAEFNLEEFCGLGLRACEIAFTYGVYIKKREDALRIGKKAKVLGIDLSIHAPYWINLNSKEKAKVEASKKRILACCEIGTLMGVKKIVFHPGFYSGMEKDVAFENIKNAILDIQKIAKVKGFTPKLAPEVMGKVNVFGSVGEVKKLVEETGCSFCVDFAHVLARYKTYRFEEIFEMFDSKDFHIHFSGIEHGEKGEKRHLRTPKDDLKKLISTIPKDKDVVIINESPSPVEDAVLGVEILKGKVF